MVAVVRYLVLLSNVIIFKVFLVFLWDQSIQHFDQFFLELIILLIYGVHRFECGWCV